MDEGKCIIRLKSFKGCTEKSVFKVPKGCESWLILQTFDFNSVKIIQKKIILKDCSLVIRTKRQVNRLQKCLSEKSYFKN